MSGYPSFNFPAFNAAAKHLRMEGYRVIAPHETDSPEAQAICLASKNGDLEATELKWGELLGRDIEIVADKYCVGVVCLDGWRFSKGARLEVFCAAQLNKPIFQYAKKYLIPIHNPLDIITTTLKET